MTLNFLIIIFLLLMAAWYSGQGLYTALIHLLLTIFSGALALALWEPIVHGVLLDLVPEYAWGVGLLLPFAVLLYGLRQLFDNLLIGNQDFPEYVNKVGGGAAGLLSGVITAGLGIMGLQMAGMPDVFGYRGWEVQDARPAQAEKLWVPVDRVTSDFYKRIGGGALHPIGTDRGMQRVHPHLAAESSFYTQGAFDLSRRSLRPDNLAYVPDNPFFALSDPPQKLAEKLPRGGPSDRIVVLGTEVTLQPDQGEGAADRDGAFRVSRQQIGLTCAAADGSIELHLPVGYIQNGEFAPMTADGAYAYSNPSVPSVRHHWVFQLPEGCEPIDLRMKQLRLLVPDEPIQQPDRLAQLLTYSPSETADADQEDQDASEDRGGMNRRGRRGGDGETVYVSDSLPFIINKNSLASENVEVVDGAIRAGSGSVEDGGRPGSNLAVDKIFSAKTARIVQVDLGSPEQSGSLLGQVMDFARRNTQAPVLVDEQGREYRAIGHGVIANDRFSFDINPNRPMRSLNDRVNLGNIRNDQRLVLYFQIPQNTRLTEFKLGESQSESVNLTVK